jgi:hypothetical protein
MIDFNFNVGIKEIHYPFYFEKRNICLDCGAEKSLTFINIFGNESNSEVFPYYKIKCNKCRYRINDAEAPTIISIFKPYSERSNIIKKDKYIDFSIEDNNASDSFWICSYCKCKNNKSKFCAFCFKNRNFNLI